MQQKKDLIRNYYKSLKIIIINLLKKMYCIKN